MSILTKEGIQKILNDDWLLMDDCEGLENCTVVKQLASMALAAMDSEPVALKPELAKVIYHFRDWNEGFPVERFKADYVISWMLANYPPAPPAPVVSADLLHTAASAIEDLLTTKDRTGAGVWFDLPFRLRSAANAQSPGSEPATVPGKWIPVSERMPEREVDVQVYCPDKKEQMVAYLERNELEGYFRFATWRTGDGIYCQPTHWMPLPAAPQEGK